MITCNLQLSCPPFLRVRVARWFGFVLGLAFASGCSTPKTTLDHKLMDEAYNTLQRQYVDRSALYPRDLTYGAIGGMVDSLGDTGHTVFLTPPMFKELKDEERGEFHGIGVEIQLKDDRVVVVAPIDGSPAQRAGLRAGDVIAKIFDQDISGWPLSHVVDEITGPPGTKVKLTIQNPHSGGQRDLTLVRADIKVHEVSWQRLPGTDVAHLRVATFDSGVSRDLRRALTEIQRANLQGVILDLRNNPGGLLDEAVAVASQFLGDGDVLLTKDATGRTDPMPVLRGGLATNMPMALLVNVGSASGSEIVAGALQDAHRSQLVGETTFGTGTVLGQFRLSDGSALLLAVQEWLTPHGRSFWHKGLTPDVKVSLTNEAAPLLPVNEREMTATDLRSSEDAQLLRALQVVQSQTATNYPNFTRAPILGPTPYLNRNLNPKKD